jgi:hypothetical protein
MFRPLCFTSLHPPRALASLAFCAHASITTMASSLYSLADTAIRYKELSSEQILYYTRLCRAIDATPPIRTPIPEEHETVQSHEFYLSRRVAFEQGLTPPRNLFDVRRLWLAWTAPGAQIPQCVRDRTLLTYIPTFACLY